VYFHGPAFQVVEAAQAGQDRVVARFKADLPPITAGPAEMLLPARLIELCLQTAGVWEIGHTGALALPTAVERVVFFKACSQPGAHGDPTGDEPSLYAEITPRIQGDDPSFDARVVDEQGNVYLELYGYRTARLPAPIDDERLAPLRDAIRG